MAITSNNIYSLQLLRNGTAYATKGLALADLQSATALENVVKKDGVAVLARYIHEESGNKQIRTLVGYYAESTAMTGTSDASSYMTIIDVEGSSADVEELKQKIGTGVTTTDTVTKQLKDLSGNTASTSADTSVEGAKRYADEKVADLDGTITADTGYYINKVDEVDGKISGTTAALPTVAAISEAGKPITAVSESLGAVSATAGTINAEYVNVTGSVFSSSTVQATLEEIDAAYKAADAAIVDNASESANTLAKLEDIVNDLSADAKEYSIVKTTTGLPATIKESYSLQDADGHVSGDTIDIPKDSHIVSINYITDTGDIHYQNLEYVYITDSGTTSTTYVDMSQLVIESEFASGVTSTNGVVHGVVDSNSETFLTVGADGFKLSGVQDAIDSAYEGLDATVTGATSGNHITISIEELDGKLIQSGLTIAEDNIANADDLAEISAKTVTEIASSNSSITVATTTTTANDGTVKYDVITDASKIQMSGFTGADVLSGITQSSSITEAFLEVDKVITKNEETVSAALNDLEESKVENIVVNGVTGTFNNKIASVTIDGNDVVLGADYVKPATSTPITTADTVDQALGKLEAKVDAAVASGVTSIVAGDGIAVDATQTTTPTVSAKLTSASDLASIGIAENAIKFDATNAPGMYIEYIDCGTY